MLCWIRWRDGFMPFEDIADGDWGLFLQVPDPERREYLMDLIGQRKIIDLFTYEAVIYWGY